MVTRQFASNDFRQRYGEMLDIVLRGDEVAITRYGRPIAVMVEAGKWEAMQQVHRDDSEYIAELQALERAAEDDNWNPALLALHNSFIKAWSVPTMGPEEGTENMTQEEYQLFVAKRALRHALAAVR